MIEIGWDWGTVAVVYRIPFGLGGAYNVLVAVSVFATSEFWMVVGSWWRRVRNRRRAQDALRRER